MAAPVATLLAADQGVTPGITAAASIGGVASRTEPISAADLLASLEAEQHRLRDLLSGRDEAVLALRPPTGKWSVLENVRHLLFAEQAHLGQFVPGGYNWHPLGYTPETMLEAKKLSPADDAPVPNVAEVLQAWQTVHANTRAALADQDTDEVRYRLGRHIKHQRSHVDAIARLIRAGP